MYQISKIGLVRPMGKTLRVRPMGNSETDEQHFFDNSCVAHWSHPLYIKLTFESSIWTGFGYLTDETLIDVLPSTDQFHFLDPLVSLKSSNGKIFCGKWYLFNKWNNLESISQIGCVEMVNYAIILKIPYAPGLILSSCTLKKPFVCQKMKLNIQIPREGKCKIKGK
jgi:hypothetical protein